MNRNLYSGNIDDPICVDTPTKARPQDNDEQESLELARRLMAEEAMASYQNAYDLLRDNVNAMSDEDYAALQAVMAEDEAQEVVDMEDDEGNLSYETMLALGERIGDVKSERWAMESHKHVQCLPTKTFCQYDCGNDDSEQRCLVCQCEYTDGEVMRRLPCKHYFHQECVDQWLEQKDACPYCRVSIVNTK